MLSWQMKKRISSLHDNLLTPNYVFKTRKKQAKNLSIQKKTYVLCTKTSIKSQPNTALNLLIQGLIVISNYTIEIIVQKREGVQLKSITGRQYRFFNDAFIAFFLLPTNIEIPQNLTKTSYIKHIRLKL